MLSNDQKLSLMKQALSLDGTYQERSVFDSFYAQDLMVFGMAKNVPEAVRVGEKMMAENGASLSFEMARAVKNYQLNHGKAYQEAMKRTGPIANTGAVYMNNRKTDDYSRDSIVNMEDPYWQEFFEKNYRTQDQWKIPSVMAWDHKKDGLLGEVMDIDQLEQKQR